MTTCPQFKRSEDYERRFLVHCAPAKTLSGNLFFFCLFVLFLLFNWITCKLLIPAESSQHEEPRSPIASTRCRCTKANRREEKTPLGAFTRPLLHPAGVQKAAAAAATDAPGMTRQILCTNGSIWKSAIPSFVFANDLDAKIFCWWALSLHWLKRLSGEKQTPAGRGETQRTSC